MFEDNVRINFFDVDPGGILFFGNYFRYAHAAFEKMMEEFNFQRDYFQDEFYAIPIVHTEADYFAPVRFGEKIKIVIKLEAVKNSSFVLNYEFVDKLNNKRALLKTVHVMINKSKIEKVNIPDELREKLNSLK